ncbi:MAG: tetratricopeptide repeat protein [Flavobacteriaceae bacterium]
MDEKETLEISKQFFDERTEEFIIYVVSKSFSIYRGSQFFKYYKGEDNYIKSKLEAKTFISKIYNWILKKVPRNSELIKEGFGSIVTPSIGNVVSFFTKLMSASQHQAVGPDIIDPIIILEEKISRKQVIEIVSLFEKKFLSPTIIIIMGDDDMIRVRELLSKCPNGTTLKLIDNTGNSEIVKVVNKGADDITDFIDLYSRQCFNACSYTQRNVLFNNEEWERDSLIRKWTPGMMKIRSNLLYDKKDESIDDVNYIISSIQSNKNIYKRNDQLVSASIECMARLFRMYCHDQGGKDFDDAYHISKEIDNEILTAHVLRFSHFLPNTTKLQQKEALEKAQKIFSKNRMEDYGVYCKNNSLMNNFYQEKIYVSDFEELRDRALQNVPGLVGMSSILNNVGVAYFYNHRLEEAIEWFTKGIAYDKDRTTQQIGLKTNILIAKSMLGIPINEMEIRSLIIENISWFVDRESFLAASYLTNILVVASKTKGLVKGLIEDYPRILRYLKIAINPKYLGSGSLSFQLTTLSHKNKEFDFQLKLPKKVKTTQGRRGLNLELTSFNPAIYNAWL